MDAIRQLKWVIGVQANVASPEDFSAYARARAEISDRLWEALKEKP
jgi:hypothetical protein